MQPNLSFNIPPHGPNDTYRPASPRTVTIFNNAAQHANVFAPNTTVRAASSVVRGAIQGRGELGQHLGVQRVERLLAGDGQRRDVVGQLVGDEAHRVSSG